MMTSTYDSLPARFDYARYYQQQASGYPQFNVFRARQRGGFIVPLLRAHGIPLLRWLGKQAASLATSAGTEYLNKGSLSKQDIKGLLKKQGKAAAGSALDRLKQQLGSGMMNHRRDMRLHSLTMPTSQQDGFLPNLLRSRGPSSFRAITNRKSSGVTRRRKNGRKKKTVTATRKTNKTKRTKTTPSSKRKRKRISKTTSNRSGKNKKKKTSNSFNHTIFS